VCDKGNTILRMVQKSKKAQQFSELYVVQYQSRGSAGVQLLVHCMEENMMT